MSFKIAILDYGVDFRHEKLRGCRSFGYEIARTEGGIQISEGVNIDKIGHGTAIASIIHKHVPDAELVSVRLSAFDDLINEEMLCEGIEFCGTIECIRIINISLGVISKTPSERLRESCKAVVDKGIFIVASTHNFPEYICYPAKFDFVWGVGCGLVKHNWQYRYVGNGYTNILAKGTTQRIGWKDNSYKITPGNSYAAAHFSGILGVIIENNLNESYERLMELARSQSIDSIKQLNYIKPEQNIDPCKKNTSIDPALLGKQLFTFEGQLEGYGRVALFPVSEKEMNTLVEFRDYLHFEIVFFIDYLKKLHKPIKGIPDDIDILQRELREDEYARFDTLVVGYFLDQPFDVNIICGINLVTKCVGKNKNFIVWDSNVFKNLNEIINSTNGAYKGKVFFSNVNQTLLKKVTYFDFLPEFNKPVLALTGTGSKQGKITAQVVIKKYLERAGYKVSFLATEPQGFLLGADMVFPYGHKSTVKIDLNQWSKYLEVSLRGMERFNKPNLILTGIQGGVIPKTPVNEYLDNTKIASLHFLTSILPDAFVCTISPSDEVGFIKRTIETIYNFCDTKLLFFIMTPFYVEFRRSGIYSDLLADYKTLDPLNYGRKALELEEQLGYRVINIMDERNEEFIVESIQKRFSRS